MRVRFRFTKLGRICWTSHRDVARMWERALRRAAVPVAYSGGFAPRPKISFGLALPTGHESMAEYLDVEVESSAATEPDVAARVSAALPGGIDVTASGAVEAGAASLQHEVTSSTWRIGFVDVSGERVQANVDRVLTAESLIVTRQRKGHDVTDDVRPAVRTLHILGTGDPSHDPDAVVLEAELGTQPRGLRPNELAAVLDPTLELGRVLRTHQWIERDGARREPLPLGATGAPHAWVRAS